MFVSVSILTALLVLDLLAAAARPGLFSSSVLRSLGQSERDNNVRPGTAATTPGISVSRARAALFLAQSVLRFAMASLVLEILSPYLNNVVWLGLTLLAAALLVGGLEWMVDDRARLKPHWTVQLSSYIRIWTFLLFPILAFIEDGNGKPNTPEPGAETAFESEMKSLVDAGQEEGILEQDERKMIYSIFRLGDTLAREIMVPRIDLTALEVRTPLSQAVDQLLSSGYSRVPVYEEGIDHILGVLYTKDLLGVWRKGVQLPLSELLRPAYFVPEAKKVDELLAEMQNQRVHMAIVVDEYGGVAGLVTLEDIVEEIVGEIQDEFDQAEESLFQEIQSGEYIFLGRVDLDAFNELMNSNLPTEEADTLGGFIYKQVGRVPTVGESVQADRLLLTVEQVTGRRIRKVRAQYLPLALEKGETKQDAQTE